MKATITTTSQTLPDILGKEKYNKLKAQKSTEDFIINIQNLSGFNVYMERKEDATVAEGYKITSLNEVCIRTKNLDDINLIADGGDAEDIRFIGN